MLARSCDVTPLDYFLWGYVKSMANANQPAMNIEREIAAVSANICLKILKNWIQRMGFCRRARAGHAKETELNSYSLRTYFYRNKEFY